MRAAPVFLFFLSFLPSVLVAQDSTRERLVLRTVNEEISIDGVIDPVWSKADSASEFFQLSPYYAQPSRERTVAKVLATREALFCLMVCYEQREDIQRTTSLHDQGGGDIVSIMLDTFNDRQSAYKFAVTASGARSDARLLDDARNRDYSWDGVWYAVAAVYDWGFVVEMKIPFTSIRYNTALTEWGLDFDRWIPSTKEDLYWCRYERNEGQRISKFGRLVLNGAKPEITGLNLEVYPVAIGKAMYEGAGRYHVEPSAGIDMFYNPSEKLTFQLTANPDFAQIEADPFSFNISRYETYFSERRPFFTEGSEIFMASGKQQNTGFYTPLELFYSRRIGKMLPGGTLVPLDVGAKAFGRFPGWEYGGFFAATGRTDFTQDSARSTERSAAFSAVRIRKQILENSSIGMLCVGKMSGGSVDGVFDIDGAFRGPTWQLAYQAARSTGNGRGDYGGSAGFWKEDPAWLTGIRFRGVGKGFNVDQVGYVPWHGTVELTGFSGPVLHHDSGAVQSVFIAAGGGFVYKNAQVSADRYAILILNMQFRANWGWEIDLVGGPSKDRGISYSSYNISLNSSLQVSPRWNAFFNTGVERTYNFSRDYLAHDGWFTPQVSWKVLDQLELGTSAGMFVEGNPAGGIEEITYNARPYFSLTPLNDLNVRVYVDNTLRRSVDKLEHVIMGFLFSYSFLPKSWIYLAINNTQDLNNGLMQTTDRVAVLKVKYLYLL